MDGQAIRLRPIYLDYGRSGYQLVFDKQLIPEEAAQAALAESNIGTAVDLRGFGTAYGVVRLASIDEDAVGVVRYRSRPSGRGPVIVGFIGVASWREIEGCQRDIEFVFRRLDEQVPLDRSPTEEDLRPLELRYDPRYDRPSSVAPLPSESEGSLIEMLAGLMAGARVVAVGYDRLEDQLALVRQLWGLLPAALARDLSFVTNALSLPEVKARLVFATLAPLPSMGRLLRTSAGGEHSLIYDPPKESVVGSDDRKELIERYFEIATKGIEQYGWEEFSRLVQETAVHPSARLDVPESFVPSIEHKLGLELFHRRREDGQAASAEVVRALERYHQQMGLKELKACLNEVLDCLEQQKLSLEDWASLRELLPSWVERGLDPLEFGRRVASVCASERVDLEAVEFFLDTVIEIFPPYDRWGAGYREVLGRLLSELYRRGMRSRRTSLFALFEPYAAWLDPPLIEWVFKAQTGSVSGIRGSDWERILQDWSTRLGQLKSRSLQERAHLEAGLATLCGTLLGALADHDPLKAQHEWLWLLDSKLVPKQKVVEEFPHQGDRAQRYLPEQKRAIAKQLLNGVIDGRFAGVESDLLQSSWGFWCNSGLTNTARVFLWLLGGQPPQQAGLLANCEQELQDTPLFLRFCQFAVGRQPQLLDGDLAQHLDHLATREGIAHYGDFLRKILGIASKAEFVAGAEVVEPLLSLAGKLQAADQFVALLEKAKGALGAEEVAQRIARYWSTAPLEGRGALCRAVHASKLSREAKRATVEKVWMGIGYAGGPQASDALLDLAIDYPPSPAVIPVQQKLARALWSSGQLAKGRDPRRVKWLTYLIVAAVRTQDASALVEIDRLLYRELKSHRDSYLLEYQQALRELLDRRALDQMEVERLGEVLESAGCFWLAHLTRTELSFRRTDSEYVHDLITRLFELEGSLAILERWNRQQHASCLQSIDEAQRQQLLDVCKSIQEILARQTTARFSIGGRSSWLQSVLKEIQDALGTS